MLTLPSDIFTEKIFLKLSTTDRYSLLSAEPVFSSLVKWDRVYQEKIKPRFDPKIVEIYEKHFELDNERKERLKAMEVYYENTNIEYYDVDKENDLQIVPIISDERNRVQDYIYDRTDYIYDEMRQLKIDRRDAEKKSFQSNT